jgi:N-acyl-D-amino-acid deacylase
MTAHFDILIRDATIVDGTGSARYPASVGICGERIAAIGDLEATANRVIEARDLIVSPGFVDPHSHADLNILDEPLAENLIMQGVTSFIGCNCGHCRAPLRGPQYTSRWNEYLGLESDSSPSADWRTLDEFLSRVETSGLALNFVPLAGHGAIRLAVMGEDFKRQATPDEVKAMKAHLRDSLEAGAFGLSVGMDYEGDYADPDAEVVELVKLVQERDGFFAPHTRNLDYRWRVDDPEDFGYGRSHGPREDAWVGRYHGIVEALETATRANKVRTHIAHFPPAWAVFVPHPESLERAIARATLEEFIDQPRSNGLQVSFNILSAEFSAGSRSAVINSFYNPMVEVPYWLRTLPRNLFLERLRLRSFRERLKQIIYSGTFKFGMLPPRTDPYWMDCFRVAKCGIHEYEGRTVGEIARERSPHRAMEAVYNQSLEAVFDMLVEDPDTTWDFVLDKRFGPVVQEVFLTHPAGFPCIDSACLPADQPSDSLSKVSPLYFGAFPNFVHAMVKEKKLLTLEQAIHKACYLPLQEIAQVVDRGVIREGACADLIVFDPDRLRMTGTFADPSLPTDGLECVLVNGQVVYEGQKPTGARPGKVLRHA